MNFLKMALEDDIKNGNLEDSTYKKPSVSYPQLIAEALHNAPEKTLVLSDIYKAINGKYPYYKLETQRWKESIRHNLSVNKNFIKAEKFADFDKRGSFWKLLEDHSIPPLKVKKVLQKDKKAEHIYIKTEPNEDITEHQRVKSEPNEDFIEQNIIKQEPNEDFTDFIEPHMVKTELNEDITEHQIIDHLDNVVDIKEEPSEDISEHHIIKSEPIDPLNSLIENDETIEKTIYPDFDKKASTSQPNRLKRSIGTIDTSITIKIPYKMKKGFDLERPSVGMQGGQSVQISDQTNVQQTMEKDNSNSEEEEESGHKRPYLSYSQLIAEALKNAPEQTLVCSDIYKAINAKHPFYQLETKGWQNSIRHNLTLNKNFIKEERFGQVGYWKLSKDVPKSLLETRPSMSYPQLIAEALSNAPEKTLVLSDIYKAINAKYPYYKLESKRWKESIRDNLNANKNFIKGERSKSVDKRGWYWKLLENHSIPHLNVQLKET